MIRWFFLSCFFLHFLIPGARGQDKDSSVDPLSASPIDSLSEYAQISLITGAPGGPLFTKFGHSAIRVYDPVNQIDEVYNYGTFDFDTEGFYIKFMRGKLNYWLSKYEFQRMLVTYRYLNQSLYEQILDLSQEEKNLVYQFLEVNYYPENRFYLYDFFYDNCSSRIRDVFKSVLGKKLIFNDDHIEHNKTFRQLLDEYLQVQAPWGDFGIDLVLGLPADKTAEAWDYMFLPFKLFDAFEYAELREGDRLIPFVARTRVLFEESGDGRTGGWFTPLIFFSGLLILVILIYFYERKRKKYLKNVDSAIFLIIGLAGLIMALLWFWTDHMATKDNLNILWAFPTHLLVPVMLYKARLKKLTSYYFLFWTILFILLLIGWKFIPQQFHVATIPILLILIIRSAAIYFNIKKQQYVEGRK